MTYAKYIKMISPEDHPLQDPIEDLSDILEDPPVAEEAPLEEV